MSVLISQLTRDGKLKYEVRAPQRKGKGIHSIHCHMSLNRLEKKATRQVEAKRNVE